RHVESTHFVRVDPDLDLTPSTADDLHVAHAVDRLDLLLDLFVGNIRDFTQRAWRRHGDTNDGGCVSVELLNDWLFRSNGKIVNDQIDLVSDFLRRDVRVLFKQERDEDLRNTFDRC